MKPNYKTIDENDMAALAKILGQGRVLSGAQILEEYSHDELGAVHHLPDVVVEPVDTEEVSAVMKYAFENSIPVTPRGLGTGLVGGCVPLYGGILMNLMSMNRILELDDENLTLTVQPGVILLDLYEYVESRGFYYPPNPGEKSACIGGNVLTNAGGMSAVKYGVTRNYVNGIEAVLPNGNIFKAGGKFIKNSSGYSLKDLLIGSEGTLAIVTEIVLRLLPLPQRQVSLLVPFSELDKAISAVPKVIKAGIIPRSLEYVEREVLQLAEEYLGKRFPHNTAPAYLLLTFDGNFKDEIEHQVDLAARVLLDAGAIDVFIANTQERSEAIWAPRGAFLEAIKASTTEMEECDVVLPRNKIAEFVAFTQELSRQYDIRIRSFGHAGDGNLHIYICRDQLDQKEWESRLENIFNSLYHRAQEFEGMVSGEHGIGYAKKKYLQQALDPAAMELMQLIKASFDPKNILNPGKVVRG